MLRTHPLSTGIIFSGETRPTVCNSSINANQKASMASHGHPICQLNEAVGLKLDFDAVAFVCHNELAG